jgi:hypothetical protein
MKITIRTQTARLETNIEVKIQKGYTRAFDSNRETITPNYDAKGEPLHSAIVSFFSSKLNSRRYRGTHYEWVLKIDCLPIVVSYDGKYKINGTALPLISVANALARVTYFSCFEDNKNVSKLVSVLVESITVPEPVSYVLENRAPYHFYSDYSKQEVRLNVQPIGDKKYAIEISDSVWGEISQKDLVTFVNSYRDKKKRGNWNNLSPKMLYSKLIGEEPSEGQLKLMKAFLSQNRTQDIVERRAKELIVETCDRLPNHFFYHKEEVEKGTTKVLDCMMHGGTVTEENNEWLFVRGKLYDWKIRKAHNGQSRQSVNTFVYNSVTDRVKTGQVQNEDGEWVDTFKKETTYLWRGPICVDNLAFNGATSVGDQMVARGYAFLNDEVTINLINTIGGNLNTKDMSEHRLDFEYLLENDLGALL